MKHLKTFESVAVLNSYIQDIKDILLELSDENWIINVRYIAKRWEILVNNNRIKCDYINVTIKKKYFVKTILRMIWIGYIAKLSL